MHSKIPSRVECSKKETERFYLLGLETVLKTGYGVYVSGPITTGRRFLSFLQRHAAALGTPEYDVLLEHEVVRPNILAHKQLVSTIAGTLALREMVIDPTVFPVLPDWTQSDYHALWATVIERWVKRVVFANDWQYSSGCTFEFLVAHRYGLTVLDAEQRPIELGRAIDLISSAVTETRRARGSAVVLERALHELSSAEESR